MIVEDAVRLVGRTLHPRWLQRPTILPDELAHSYALRVLVLNEADSLESLIAAVSADGVVDPKVPKAQFLAWVADVDVSEFLRFHTRPLSAGLHVRRDTPFPWRKSGEPSTL